MADKPITTEDLYGTTDKPQAGEQVKDAVLMNQKPIAYEETPEIPMSVEAGSRPAGPTKKKSGCLGTILTIIMFLELFIAGIWLSSFVRQFFPNTSTTQETETSVTPTITTRPGTTATGSAAVAAWKTYQVISGTTKAAFGGVTFQLPPDVLSPICDGTGCASQGTYLPGGTRFTVAPRGVGQALADFRGSVISDVGGISFTTKATTVAGLPGMEFTGLFTGRTISGYGFSRMRGVMIELTSTTSLEVNHFTPNGIVADFALDDTLFDAIVKTIKVPGSTAVTTTVTPTKTPTPTTLSAPPTATPSGY